MNDVERAERIQAWKAFLIPSTLFLACLMNAAGIYMIYAGNSIGAVFLGGGFLTIICAMFAFITFQNTTRAAGHWKQVSDDLPEHVADGELSDEELEIEEDREPEHASVR